MGIALVNGRFSLEYPDGFHAMDDAEMSRAYGNDNPNRWGIWDTDRHIIIAMYWHNPGAVANTLFGGMADLASLIKRAENHTKKAHKKLGYAFGSFFETAIAGQESRGFTYAYTVSGIPQAGQSIIFRESGITYTVQCLTQRDLAEANRSIIEAVLASIRLA